MDAGRTEWVMRFLGRNEIILSNQSNGGMAERTKAAVLKTAIRATVSWVRIPLPPPVLKLKLANPGMFLMVRSMAWSDLAY